MGRRAPSDIGQTSARIEHLCHKQLGAPPAMGQRAPVPIGCASSKGLLITHPVVLRPFKNTVAIANELVTLGTGMSFENINNFHWNLSRRYRLTNGFDTTSPNYDRDGKSLAIDGGYSRTPI
eukprot:sb/3475914/